VSVSVSDWMFGFGLATASAFDSDFATVLYSATALDLEFALHLVYQIGTQFDSASDWATVFASD
jgi:hypothetical protein